MNSRLLLSASSFGNAGVDALLEAAFSANQICRGINCVVEIMGMLSFAESLLFLVCDIFDRITNVE